MDDLIEAWRTNNRINLMILDEVSSEGMRATLSKRGGRGVAGEFAHMHNLRVWQLEKRAKHLTEGLSLFETKDVPPKRTLRSSLVRSARAVEGLLDGVAEGRPKHRGFRKGVFTTLAYFVSHEAHHRGRILLTLKVSGHTLDRATLAGIWAWDQV